MKPDQGEKHKTVYAIKSDPNVMKMVTRQQNSAGTSVAFNPENVKGCVDSSMPQEDRHGVEVPTLNHAGGLGPYISKLPRELRDQIFSGLLTSGHPQFTSVSRAMNFEGMALVYQKGVYRVNLGFDVNRHRPVFLEENCTSPIEKVADKIRSLSIKVTVKDFSSSIGRNTGQFRDVDTLMGFPLRQGHCSISGCCNTYAKSVFGIFLWNMVLIARGFVEYETVVLHIDTNKFLDYHDWEAQRILTFRCSSKKYLEPFLGKEIVRSDKDGLELVFHPREVRREVVRELDQVSRATNVHTYMKTQMGQRFRDLWIGGNISARLSELDADGRRDFLSWSDSSLAHKSDVLECGQSPALQQKQSLYIDFWMGEGVAI